MSYKVGDIVVLIAPVAIIPTVYKKHFNTPYYPIGTQFVIKELTGNPNKIGLRLLIDGVEINQTGLYSGCTYSVPDRSYKLAITKRQKLLNAVISGNY